MTTFIQHVFNKISLERDQELWESDDDSQTKERIKFLSEFEETLFAPQLLNDDKDVSKDLQKNVKMCDAFRRKLEELSSNVKQEKQEEKLKILNQALCFAEVPEKRSCDYCDNTFISLLHERIALLSNLKHTKEALEDVKVLEEYICNLEDNASAPKLAEYYTEFFKLRFNLVLDDLDLDDEEKNSNYRKQFKYLEISKNYKGIRKMISTLDQLYATNKQNLLISDDHKGINHDRGKLILDKISDI